MDVVKIYTLNLIYRMADQDQSIIIFLIGMCFLFLHTPSGSVDDGDNFDGGDFQTGYEETSSGSFSPDFSVGDEYSSSPTVLQDEVTSLGPWVVSAAYTLAGVTDLPVTGIQTTTRKVIFPSTTVPTTTKKPCRILSLGGVCIL